MEKNGFTITPENGSNNGKITVNVASTEDSRSYELRVEGAGIVKSCMLRQNGIKSVPINFTTNTNDLFSINCAVIKDTSETSDLSPNYANVAFNAIASSDCKVVKLTAFNERASHNIGTYRTLIDYRVVDASKKVGLHIIIEKFPKNTYINSDNSASAIWSTYRVIRIAATMDANTVPREQRMTSYKKLAYELTAQWNNYTPDSVRQLIFMDSVITKADGDILRAESVAGKVNVQVIGALQQ